jgi:hypothetical protein
MVELTVADIEAIGRAGELLDTVGRGGTCDASLAATYCLQAADELSSVVPLAPSLVMGIQQGETVVAIGEALRLLATLSEPVFGLSVVVAAVDAAQQAHRVASA